MKEVIHSDIKFRYEEDDCFEIENSKLHSIINNKIGEIKTVEFVWYRREKDVLLFIEAKPSFSNPNNPPKKEGHGFDANIDEIYQKFICSLELYFAAILKRQNDNEICENLKTLNYKAIDIKCLLIIKGHTKIACRNIMNTLSKRLKKHMEIWKIKIGVLNDEIALQYGIINGIINT